MSARRWAVLAIASLLSANAATAAPQPACQLTAADKAANRTMSFDDFDQKGVAPSTWRALEVAGCHGLAAEAADDYLANGPAQTPGHKSDILFHEAQSLAMLGDNVTAARLVSAAIPAGREIAPSLDWTAYLVGTRAFLVKDRVTLDAAVQEMAREQGYLNRLDGGILAGQSRCFDKPYKEAYTLCRPPDPPK